MAGGLLLNTHLSVEIAVVIVGARTGLLSPATTTAVTLFAILTVLFMPVIFGMIAPPSKKSKRQIIAICGAGSEALGVAQELKAHGETVVLFNENQEFVQQAQRSGFETVLLDSKDMISGLDPDRLKGILALCLDDDTNMALCRAAESAGIKPIVARVNDPARLPEFRRLGVQPFIPTLSHNVLLALMVRNPDVYTLLTSVTDDRDVREVTLRNPELSGQLLRGLNLPGETLILSISRDGEYIIPHGNVEMKFGDRLALLGCPEELDAAIDLLGG